MRKSLHGFGGPVSGKKKKDKGGVSAGDRWPSPFASRPPPFLPPDQPDLIRTLIQWLPGLDPLSGIRELTEFDDILEYFQTKTPDDFEIKAGVLLKQRSGGSYLLAQCFLNAAGNVCRDRLGRPYGRIFRTLEFDHRLYELFGNKDLIIFT
jgi:hypothetical protein